MRWIASRSPVWLPPTGCLTSPVVGRAGDLQHTTHRGQRQGRSRFPLLLDQGDHLVFEDAALGSRCSSSRAKAFLTGRSPSSAGPPSAPARSRGPARHAARGRAERLPSGSRRSCCRHLLKSVGWISCRRATAATEAPTSTCLSARNLNSAENFRLDNLIAPLSIHCKKMLNELSHSRGPLQYFTVPCADTHCSAVLLCRDVGTLARGFN